VILARDRLATNPGAQFPGETLKVWDTKTWTLAADFHFGQRGTPVFSIAFIPNDSPLTTLGPLSRSFEFTVGGESIRSGAHHLLSLSARIRRFLPYAPA